LLKVKLKALSMEEKDANLLWDAIQKDIGKVYKKYERNERLYRHKISQMERVMPSFEYEPLVLFPKLEISDEEENRGDTNGVGPLGTKMVEQLVDLKGRKDSPKKEVVEQTLEQIKSILQEVSY